MNKKQPLISIIMATFNDNVNYLKIAIDSIINQTYTNWEFLIVDDSNDSKSISVLDNYANKDNRIKVIRGKERYGFVKSLNVGIDKAKGDFVGRMDSDDFSAPERLKREVDFLINNQNYGVVGTQTYIINESNKITSKILFPRGGLKLRRFAIFRCPMQHGTILMRRKIIDAGIRYDEAFKRSEDLELWLRLLKKKYRIYNIQECLYKFRIESNYATKRNKKHFRFNLRARLKNFDIRHPLFSIFGIIMTLFYLLVPLSLKDKVYVYLNNK